MATSDNWKSLNGFNQMAPRAYNRYVLCFQVEDNEAAVAHLKLCVAKLAQARPELTSQLNVNRPIARIKQESGRNIPVEVLEVGEKLGISYPDLQRLGFPASYFVHDVFRVPSNNDIPALIIRIYLLDGGLILGLHLHHSIGDGHEVGTLITWLSAESRADVVDQRSISFTAPLGETPTITTGKGVNDLPEWKVIPSSLPLSGPTEKHVGEIFRFDINILDGIRCRIGTSGGREKPSTTVVLAAYIWALATKARLEGLRSLEEIGKNSRLFIPVDVRRPVLAFQNQDKDQYFGNATELSLSSIDTAELLKVCDRPNDSDVDLDLLSKRLEPLTRCIQHAIGQVDEVFVQKRYDIYAQERAPTNFVPDVDPSDKNAFVFNAWRYIGTGADQKWNIPGSLKKVGPRYPDCGRRAGGEWNFAAAVIMPSFPGARRLEVMITLEISALSMLKADPTFKHLTGAGADET
ncbi:hypothetical protein F5Y19DRAFT_238577 [Xylariaceae sp. FL1651]|nr:hypothetical protein F5Y19DRAFT_238577 [Xylariaceae sp. FL1651]